MDIITRVRKAWNAFLDGDSERDYVQERVSYSRPDLVYLQSNSYRSTISTVYNRIAVDCLSYDIRHIITDDKNRYASDVHSELNKCLTSRANKDQTARAFFIDVILSLFSEGQIAVVPIDTIGTPSILDDSYDIKSLRVAKIEKWMPDAIIVDVYNDRIGEHQKLTFPKKICAIMQNPFYQIMNETNSTGQRLMNKLSILDAIDAQAKTSKLNIIVQVPYSARSELQKDKAAERTKEIATALQNSEYGIAYMDATEKITQLNRPLGGEIAAQVDTLTKLLFSQLGVTASILDGTADPNAMNNYRNRLLVPILQTIVDEFSTKFLSARQVEAKQTIRFFNSLVTLLPLANLPQATDIFCRNAIMSPNEIREIIGFKPSDDADSDKIYNRNMPSSPQVTGYNAPVDSNAPIIPPPSGGVQ